MQKQQLKIIFFITFLISAITPFALRADDGGDDGGSYVQAYGTLQSFPAGLIGSWTIDGISYVADSSTKFEQEHGQFGAGKCVEVKYLPSSKQALEIQTENAYKCSGGSSSGNREIKGVLESFPPTLVGNWIVNGVTYTAVTSTQFEQEHGPFLVGGCIEVKFDPNTNGAAEIGTTNTNNCVGTTSPAEMKFYGFIETIPAGNVGTWAIDGTSFESSITTQLKQEHSVFAPGVCAAVEYYVDGSLNRATEIGTEDAYHCNGGTYTNKAYGSIDSFPTTHYGSWVVDGTTYVARVGATEFSQDDGSFGIGACVEIRYATQGGIHEATKIETQNGAGCANGATLPSISKVYATIDSFPAAPYIGAWQIGGIDYEATAVTQFDEEDGLFGVGLCVQVEYSVVNGSKILSEVNTEKTYKCQGTAGTEFSSYGVVETMPSSLDFTGTWQISGIPFTANGSTKISQEHGFFAVGAYVEVKYVVSGTTNVITKIETHVAPGAGSDTSSGVLDAHDSSDDWNDWTVDGTTYTADSVIEVGVDVQSPLVGNPVIFNSYVKNGVRYVTNISFANQAFLPTIQNK